MFGLESNNAHNSILFNENFHIGILEVTFESQFVTDSILFSCLLLYFSFCVCRLFLFFVFIMYCMFYTLGIFVWGPAHSHKFWALYACKMPDQAFIFPRSFMLIVTITIIDLPVIFWIGDRRLFWPIFILCVILFIVQTLWEIIILC